MKNEKTVYKKIDGGVTAPNGFKAAGIKAGIKKDGKSDMAIVLSENRASSAGIFTLNKVKGHSLLLSESNLKDGFAQCIFINSGNANACLGPKGMNDAKEIASLCSRALNVDEHDVLPASTGVIGHPLPMELVKNGIEKACRTLSDDGGHDAAVAIMTTDTYPKECAVEYEMNGFRTILGAMAKGSGMIHPNMATMIGIITTDANISPVLLKKLLKKAADKSFNRISVDGDTSVCDKILIMANGMSDAPEIKENTPELIMFYDALEILSVDMAKMIASDGEGATKLIEVNVINADSDEDAHKAAKAIANSPLVKTAFYGEDANWGRLLTAAGYSGADFDPESTSITIGHMKLYDKGVAIPFDEDEARQLLSKKDIIVTVDFGTGKKSTTVWTCDLSHDYIDINAHYRT